MEAKAGVQTTVTTTKKKIQWKKVMLPWLMLSPTIFLLLLVISGPLLGTIWLGFTDWDGIHSPKFIGLENFKQLLKDQIYFAALKNNFKWMLFFLTIPVIIGFSLAYLISRIKRGQMLYRTLLFIPYIISTVVTAKIWHGIYNPYVGINTKFKEWGWDFLALSWLGDIKIALYSVALTDGWHFWGFLIVLFLVALQQLDKHLEEAARVEGANKLQILWHVVFPQLRPTFILVYMLLIIWSFAAFDYVYVMTQGGPGNATELMATYMYKQAIYGSEPGYASSIALTMGIYSLIVILAFGWLKKKGWDV